MVLLQVGYLYLLEPARLMEVIKYLGYLPEGSRLADAPLDGVDTTTGGDEAEH